MNLGSLIGAIVCGVLGLVLGLMLGGRALVRFPIYGVIGGAALGNYIVAQIHQNRL